FSAIVEGNRIKLTCLSDQPYGAKRGDCVVYQPQLFLNGVEQTCGEAILLDTDLVNPNYHQNVLEWDYSICKRRLRIIEGRVLGSWLFSSSPNGEVRIKYSQSGEMRLRLSGFKVNDDEELIPASIFDEAEYPFEVSDTATFYPDADPETSSVDGVVADTNNDLPWADLIAEPGSSAGPSTAGYVAFLIGSSSSANKWKNLYRTIFLFDTSSLPDNATITAATLSLYGGSL
ncbi:MAG: hypothetical protein QMC90_04290, partial [Dehalococcoidales bacterium]|nr:hypothetical protein [Dehalococcoidales bacterium]